MRVYRRGDEVLVAACDADLLGKSFREGELRIEVSSFYDGLIVHKDELIRHMKLATIANFVGEKVVGIAIEEGYVDKENIIRIGGIPHAQMVLI
ncbi:MAG: DUF424 family protein [Thermoplasmata archaeon]|nr:DUF424 family protein [Thermoplasmata archaeon]